MTVIWERMPISMDRQWQRVRGCHGCTVHQKWRSCVIRVRGVVRLYEERPSGDDGNTTRQETAIISRHYQIGQCSCVRQCVSNTAAVVPAGVAEHFRPLIFRPTGTFRLEQKCPLAIIFHPHSE